MRMAIMWNACVLLFLTYIPEWTERHSFHSAPRGRMNRMLRMKIQNGGGQDKRCQYKRAPTGPAGEKSGCTYGYNETLLLIHCIKSTRCLSVIFLSRERQFRKWLPRTWKQKTYPPSAANCKNRWKCLTSSFRKCEDNNNKSGRHICHALFTLTRTAHLGGRFFMRAATNHSYSRIVNKKTRP